jgi:hypothetical protein
MDHKETLETAQETPVCLLVLPAFDISRVSLKKNGIRAAHGSLAHIRGAPDTR